MTEPRTKLLWHSNAPFVSTGYGQQTAIFAPRLRDRYDVAISTFHGLDAAPIMWDGIKLYPGLSPDCGNNFLIPHARDHFDNDPRGGLVVTLMDVWVLLPQVAAALNMACWCPVDHEPAPPAVLNFFLKSGAVPLAMSEFGMRQLGRLDPIYVPHGVDTTVFEPQPQVKARRAFGVPEDAFVVGIVAANKGHSPSRKGFSEALQAFRLLREEHDNAMLYLHTVLAPEFAQGEDIAAIVEQLGIPQESVKAADPYRMMFDPFSPRAMALMYSTMDVLLNPAMGEGFGIPVLEAQACGIPAIVTNFSAMPEVCGAGWHVACRPFWTGQKSWQATPDVQDIAEALQACYAMSKPQRLKMSGTARSYALDYDADRVLRRNMLPALRIVEQRFRDREPVTIPALPVEAAA